MLPDNPDCFHSNPEDAGRFVNHSEHFNVGMNGALRDIKAGEVRIIENEEEDVMTLKT